MAIAVTATALMMATGPGSEPTLSWAGSLMTAGGRRCPRANAEAGSEARLRMHRRRSDRPSDGPLLAEAVGQRCAIRAV